MPEILLRDLVEKLFLISVYHVYAAINAHAAHLRQPTKNRTGSDQMPNSFCLSGKLIMPRSARVEAGLKDKK